MSKRRAQKPSEVQEEKVPVESTSEVKEEVSREVSTSEVEVATLTLDEFLKAHPVNPGLVASFKWEAGQDPSLLEEKSEDGWRAAFKAQSNKTYN